MKGVVRGFPTAPGGRSIWVLVGGRLRALRLQLDLTIDDVAEKLQIEASSYERYEAGVEQIPAQLLTEVAEIFGVPVLGFFLDVIDGPDEVAPLASAGQPPIYRVATMDERAQCMADRFRKLDIEGQQHLLAIAAALSQTEAGLATESNGHHMKARSSKPAPRGVQRRSSLQNSSRKSK
jgi:transcriptional regulator with XRE-family HTH domain